MVSEGNRSYSFPDGATSPEALRLLRRQLSDTRCSAPCTLTSANRNDAASTAADPAHVTAMC